MDCCNWNDDICYETKTDSAILSALLPLWHTNHSPTIQYTCESNGTTHDAANTVRGRFILHLAVDIREQQLNQHPEQQITTST